MTHRLAQRDAQAQRAVQAAEGWLALGAAQAALEELASVNPADQQHPAVLHQRARVFVALGRVPEARAIIHQLARIAPDRRLALLDDPELDPVWM